MLEREHFTFDYHLRNGDKIVEVGRFIQQWIHWLFTSRHDTVTRLSKDHEFVSVLLIHSGEKECVSYGLLQSLMFAKVHDDLDCISQRSQIVGLDLLLGLYKSQCDHHLILKNLLTFMSLSWSVSHVALSLGHTLTLFSWCDLHWALASDPDLKGSDMVICQQTKTTYRKLQEPSLCKKVLLAKLHWSDNLIHVLPYDLKLDLIYCEELDSKSRARL